MLRRAILVFRSIFNLWLNGFRQMMTKKLFARMRLTRKLWSHHLWQHWITFWPNLKINSLCFHLVGKWREAREHLRIRFPSRMIPIPADINFLTTIARNRIIWGPSYTRVRRIMSLTHSARSLGTSWLGLKGTIIFLMLFPAIFFWKKMAPPQWTDLSTAPCHAFLNLRIRSSAGADGSNDAEVHLGDMPHLGDLWAWHPSIACYLLLWRPTIVDHADTKGMIADTLI